MTLGFKTRLVVPVAALVLALGVGTAWAANAMSGTWAVSVKTQAGNGDVTFTLEQEGDKLSGTYKGSLGEQPVTGKVTDDSFELSFQAEAMGTPLDVKYTGKIDADKISGKVVLGSFGEGTFTGEKKQ